MHLIAEHVFQSQERIKKVNTGYNRCFSTYKGDGKGSQNTLGDIKVNMLWNRRKVAERKSNSTSKPLQG